MFWTRYAFLLRVKILLRNSAPHGDTYDFKEAGKSIESELIILFRVDFGRKIRSLMYRVSRIFQQRYSHLRKLSSHFPPFLEKLFLLIFQRKISRFLLYQFNNLLRCLFCSFHWSVMREILFGMNHQFHFSSIGILPHFGITVHLTQFSSENHEGWM